MMNYLDEIDRLHPVRRSAAEKENFRFYARNCFESMNADARCEKAKNDRHKNLVVGDIESAKIIFTAHYDTPMASPFPNLMLPRSPFLFWVYQFVPIILMLGVSLLFGYLSTLVFESSEGYAFFFGFLFSYYLLFFLLFKTFKNRRNRNDNTSGVATVMQICAMLSEEERKKCAFVLFDNEEKGKLGSKAFFSIHKEALSATPVLNFDCVGNGENIIFIAKPAAEGTAIFQALKNSFCTSDEYSVEFHSTKGSEANSDHKSFPLGIGCVASKKSARKILYTPRIHTKRDTIARQENIDFITNGATSFIKSINS